MSEAKARLKLIADWWEPSVLRYNEPGCLLQVAFENDGGGYTELCEATGLGNAGLAIIDAWDTGDREAALRLIAALR